MTTEGNVRLVQLRRHQIRVLPNYRLTVNKESLGELALSMKSEGQQQPGKVRPVPPGQGDANITHELVFGQRRIMAHEIAWPDDDDEPFLALEQEMTDEEVKRAQLAENIQREDPHPLEEAIAFKALQEDFGMTIEGLMQMSGKGRTYVYDRIKLLSLGEVGRKAMLDGLWADLGIRIARMPDKIQPEAVKMMKAEDGGWITVKRGKVILETALMRTVYKAPFDPTDPELCPSAGSCTSCPYLTANDPGLVDDLGPDVCTNVPCFEIKVKTHIGRVIAKAEKDGFKTLSQDAAKLKYLGGMSWTDFRDSADRFTDYTRMVGPVQISYAEAVDEMKREGQLVPEPIVAAHPKDGTAVYLYPDSTAKYIEGWFTWEAYKMRQAAKEPAKPKKGAATTPPPAAKTAPTPSPAAQAPEGGGDDIDDPDDDDRLAAAVKALDWVRAGNRTPEEVQLDEMWPVVRMELMRRALGAPRTTDDLRLIAHALLQGEVGNEPDVHEMLGWDYGAFADDVAREEEYAWFAERLDAMGPDELAGVVVMLALACTPFTDSHRKADTRAEKRRHAALYGVDVLNPSGVEADEAGSAGNSSAAVGREHDEETEA